MILVTLIAANWCGYWDQRKTCLHVIQLIQLFSNWLYPPGNKLLEDLFETKCLDHSNPQDMHHNVFFGHGHSIWVIHIHMYGTCLVGFIREFSCVGIRRVSISCWLANWYWSILVPTNCSTIVLSSLLLVVAITYCCLKPLSSYNWVSSTSLISLDLLLKTILQFLHVSLALPHHHLTPQNLIILLQDLIFWSDHNQYPAQLTSQYRASAPGFIGGCLLLFPHCRLGCHFPSKISV